jgi:hypothetical protein
MRISNKKEGVGLGHKKCGCCEEKKHYECECQERRNCHVHTYCIWTTIDKCHRHGIKGMTSAAADTPCHKHEYKGITSCNDGHTHCYDGCTGPAREAACGHVHDICGKTSKNLDHYHKYDGCTSRPMCCR